MPHTLDQHYTFHSVGQGLFATGSLTSSLHKISPKFLWAYDCGTTSAQVLLSTAIDRVADKFDGEKPRLNLLVISHFDKDHISGLVSLLQRFRVDILILPYMPLWERLVIAFDEGVETQQDFMRFFVNPVEFILDREGVHIGQVLLVLDDVNKEHLEEPDEDIGEPNSIPEDDWPLGFYDVNPDQDDQAIDLDSFRHADPNVPVGFIRNCSSLTIANSWEFVPYNDAGVIRSNNSTFNSLSEFQSVVAELRSSLLSTPSEAVLKKIKDEYDNYFGNSGKKKNIISLFLYTGPINAPLCNGHREYVECLELRTDITRYCKRYITEDSPCRFSILYTGDGYLDTPERFNSLEEHLGPYRIKRIACLQVMHHGARDNWYEGVAARIDPNISVFSSDPSHKTFKHPHAEVLRDFWPYGPVQVSKQYDVSIQVCKH